MVALSFLLGHFDLFQNGGFNISTYIPTYLFFIHSSNWFNFMRFRSTFTPFHSFICVSTHPNNNRPGSIHPSTHSLTPSFHFSFAYPAYSLIDCLLISCPLTQLFSIKSPFHHQTLSLYPFVSTFSSFCLFLNKYIRLIQCIRDGVA